MSADPAVWPAVFQRLPLPRLITKLGDSACGKPLRKEDIDAVCQYGKMIGRLLEDSAEHLKKKAKDGCVVA